MAQQKNLDPNFYGRWLEVAYRSKLGPKFTKQAYKYSIDQKFSADYGPTEKSRIRALKVVGQKWPTGQN
jgi:hypothetical protein